MFGFCLVLTFFGFVVDWLVCLLRFFPQFCYSFVVVGVLGFFYLFGVLLGFVVVCYFEIKRSIIHFIFSRPHTK